MSFYRYSTIWGLSCYLLVVLFQNQPVSSLSLRPTDFQKLDGPRSSPMVNTTYGRVQGVFLNNGARAFLGIPYAAPPVGKLRWQPPQKPAKWNVYNATRQPPGCPQICHDPVDSCPLFILEDCLYLNIYTPSKANSSSNLPVMMFIHGGNFLSGGASSVLYDGRFLTLLSDTVVVTTNYRLGALGFMSTTCIADEPCLTGNYGFMDQRAAMQFIHENIASFGGNPNKVTLFGQSAGAESVALHLTNSASDKYFQQAIIGSSPFVIPHRSYTNAGLLGDLTTTFLNCLPGDLDCLRERTPEEVVDAGISAGQEIVLDILQPFYLFQPWGPIMDGKVVSINPLDAFREGKFQRKPLLIGTTTEEGRIYMWEAFSAKPSTIDTYAFLTYFFGPETTLRISREYNFTDFDDLREPMSTMTTDYVFTCATFNGSRYMSSYNNQSRVFHYVYDHAISFPSVWDPYFTECHGHVCHGSELPLLWQTQGLRGYNFTKEEQQLANAINNYWSNFVHTGNPNNITRKPIMKKTKDTNIRKSKVSKVDKKLMTWPTYEADSGWQSLLFQTSGNELLSKFRDKFCRLFDDVGYTPDE